MDLNSRKGRFGIVGALLLAAVGGGYLGARWQALQEERAYHRVHSLDQVEVSVSRLPGQVTPGPSVDVFVRNGENVFYLNDVARFAQQVEYEVRSAPDLRADEQAMRAPLEKARCMLEGQNPAGIIIRSSLDYGVNDSYAPRDTIHVGAYNATFELLPRWP